MMSICCGLEHSLSLDDNGIVWLFGLNWQWEIPDFDTPFVRQLDIKDVAVSIACGLEHCVIVSMSGNVWSLGKNTYGQLGLDDYEDREQLEMLTSIQNIMRVFCTDYASFCIDETSKVYSFGRNLRGSLGIKSYSDNEAKPQKVKLDTEIDYIEGVEDHTLFLSTSNEIYLSGTIWNMELLNSIESQYTPVKLTVSYLVRGIASTKECIMLLSTQDEIFVYKKHVHSFKINDLAIDKELVLPDNIPMSIHSGISHFMIIDTKKRLWTIGKNEFYQCGQKENPATLKMLEIENVISVSTGGNHTPVKTSDIVYGFGNNDSCQIGLMGVFKEPTILSEIFYNVIGSNVSPISTKQKSAKKSN